MALPFAYSALQTMFYLIETYWFWFVVAAIVGYETPPWRGFGGWPRWVSIAFGIGIVAIFSVRADPNVPPDRAGLYLEMVLGVVFSYVVGTLLGSLLSKARGLVEGATGPIAMRASQAPASTIEAPSGVTGATAEPSRVEPDRARLSDLSDKSAVLRAMAEYDELGRDAFLARYGYGPARSYFVVHDGKRYDSKALAGAAVGKQFPASGPLAAAEFSGGEATVKAKLEQLGFELTGTAREAEARRRAEQAKTAKVFISYRRDDSAGSAGRVHDRLQRDLGRDLLFMDVDAIPLGMNFVKILREEVAKCGVLLAVMGPRWCDACDDHGNRRLDDPNDFVRIEIATALQRGIAVIPILVDGAKVPKADQLSEDLKELVLRNGLDVRHASFRNDMDKLIRELRSLLNLGDGTKS
jgi:hypothetical protein